MHGTLTQSSTRAAGARRPFDASFQWLLRASTKRAREHRCSSELTRGINSALRVACHGTRSSTFRLWDDELLGRVGRGEARDFGVRESEALRFSEDVGVAQSVGAL